MSENNNVDRYSFVASDGRRLTYDGAARVWRHDLPGNGGVTLTFPEAILTPADFCAAADIIERWEADHALKRILRKRVVRGTGKWTRHGASYIQHHAVATDEDARLGLGLALWGDAVISSDDLAAILDLRDNGAWEASHDGGQTWTPTHTEPQDGEVETYD